MMAQLDAAKKRVAEAEARMKQAEEAAAAAVAKGRADAAEASKRREALLKAKQTHLSPAATATGTPLVAASSCGLASIPSGRYYGRSPVPASAAATTAAPTSLAPGSSINAVMLRFQDSQRDRGSVLEWMATSSPHTPLISSLESCPGLNRLTMSRKMPITASGEPGSFSSNSLTLTLQNSCLR